MKKIFSIVALAVLVSSCGNHLSLIKRHYTGGYYVQNSGHVHKVPLAKVNNTNGGVEKMQPVNGVLASAEKAPVFNASIKTQNTEVKKQKSSYTQMLGKHMPASTVDKHAGRNTVSHAERRSIKNAEKASKSDTNIVVLVILSLFPILCLIAVYLHDGSITLNFWVDLLLHLTAIGEIIFAILVVLDVVNLA